MSCDVALATKLSAAILFAAFHPATRSDAPPLLVLIADAPAAATAENPLAREPLYADIVRRAGSLKAQVSAYRAAPGAAGTPLPGFAQFKSDIAALSALDMQGHVDLAKRGTDGDLKCILKGISQDLPRKLDEVEQAATADTRSAALQDMYYLLRDNVEVITSPPAPTV